jgi:hypothetical protein
MEGFALYLKSSLVITKIMGKHEIVRLRVKNLVYVFTKTLDSIPHRRYIYLEQCTATKSWYMKQTTTFKNNFMISKFCAKVMSKFQQAFLTPKRSSLHIPFLGISSTNDFLCYVEKKVYFLEIQLYGCELDYHIYICYEN